MDLKKVMKRDGRIERFDKTKIYNSIHKSLWHAHRRDEKLARKLAEEAVIILSKKYKNKTVPVEEIKEVVEFVLVKNKFPKVAEAYILYRFV